MTNFLNSVQKDPIPLFTPKEVAELIRMNLNHKAASGFDLVTAALLEKCEGRSKNKPTTLNIASVRLKHVAASWKVSEKILLINLSEDHTEVESYRHCYL